MLDIPMRKEPGEGVWAAKTAANIQAAPTIRTRKNRIDTHTYSPNGLCRYRDVDHINPDKDTRRRYANGIINILQTQGSGTSPAKARPRTSKLTSRPYVLIAIAILFTGIYGLDYSAGRDLSLWLLYIVPIALGTFAMGPRCGIVKLHRTIARTDYSDGVIYVTQTSQSTYAGKMHLA